MYIKSSSNYETTLLLQAANHKELVVIISDTQGEFCLSAFQKEYPNQYVVCAEDKILARAIDMAEQGMVPFVFFPEKRANDENLKLLQKISHFKLLIRIISIYVNENHNNPYADWSQHIFSQICLIPDMTIIYPADEVEARLAIDSTFCYHKPVCLCLCESPMPVIHKEFFEFQVGKGEIIRYGKDVAVISSGNLVNESINISNRLAKKGIDVMVISMATVNPLDKLLIVEAAEKCKIIVTLENCASNGGLGERVFDLLSKQSQTPIWRISGDGEISPLGSYKKHFHLSSECIMKVIENLYNTY